MFLDPPFITVQDDTVSVLRGSTASLHCNATSELDVSLSWVFEGSPLLPMNSTVSDDGRTLTVGTESLDNGGVYSCVATDGISIVSKDVRLSILCKQLNELFIVFILFYYFIYFLNYFWVHRSVKYLFYLFKSLNI